MLPCSQVKTTHNWLDFLVADTLKVVHGPLRLKTDT